MVWDFLSVIGVPVVLYYLSKWLWRIYILRTADDPSTDLKHLPIPPGDFGLPLVGETISWAIEGSRFNAKRREKYGKVFSTNFIFKTMVKVTGPEYVRQILTADHDTITTIWPTTVRSILGEHSIANTIGGLHRYKRKVCLKAFTHSALNSYIPAIQREVKRRMTLWKDAETPTMYQETKELTFDVAFSVLVGLNFRDNQERQNMFKTFDDMISNLFSMPFDLPGSGFRKGLKSRKILHDLLDVHLKEKREKVKKSIENEADEQPNNVLQYILEAELKDKLRRRETINDGKSNSNEEEANEDEEDYSLSDIELKETTVEMMFAGYQTTASVATSCVLNLIQNPEAFQKLENEIREHGFLPDSTDQKTETLTNGSQFSAQTAQQTEAVQESASSNLRNRHLHNGKYPTTRDTTNNNNNCFTSSSNHINNNFPKASEEPEISLEKLSKMPYLEQLIKETLRLMPPILGGYRKALKTFQLGKYRVPKGWTIIYNIRDTHESEWSEDMTFKPERFAPETWKENREGRFRWIPFGGGSRICVGKEFARLQIKVILIEMIKTFKKIEFAKGKPPKMFAIPFLHPTDGMPVKLTLRR